MRVLQINPNGSDASALDLHPMISVVTGLGEDGHNLVLKAFQAMARGADPGCGGLLEAHGVLFDLTTASINMLDLSARAEVIIGPDDIAAVGSANADNAPAPTFDRAQIDQFVDEVAPGEYPALDAAKQTKADATEARGILTEAADKARVKYEQVEAELRRTQAELEVARNRPRLRIVTEDDADADADDTEVVSIDRIREMHQDLSNTVDALLARGAQIERGLKELSSIDIRPLNVLLDAIRSPSPVELVPSERAQELADDVKLLEARVAELERDLDDQGMGTAAVMARLEECRAEVAAAERSMKKPELSPTDVEELEAAHEKVLEAEQKASSGLFKGGARKALEEGMAAQQVILDRVGYPTWTAYVMGASLLSIDPVAEQRLEKARLDLEGAEAHWARITEVIESNPEHRHLLNRLEEVYLEAYDLLDGEEPDDLENALRNLQVARREVTTEELADALAYQLELLGLPLGEAPSIDLVVMAADAFVEEANEISGRITELKGDRARVDAELADARMRIEELPPLPEPQVEPVPEPEPVAEFDSFGSFDEPAPAEDGGFGSFDSFGSFGSFEEPAAAEGPSGEPEGGAGGAFDAFPSLVGFDDAEGGSGPEDDLYALAASGDADEDGDEDDGTGAPSESVRAEDLVADLERALEIAEEEEAEYREWVESRDALVDTALQIETVATTKLTKIAVEILTGLGSWVPDASSAVEDDGIPDPDAVTAFLHERIGALRQVSFAGSVPLVLDDALRALPTPDIRQILNDIEDDAALVQIVYLTDDADLIGWADEVGFQRAAVVDAPPAFR